MNGGTRAAGTEDPFGSFGPGPSSGSEPYADQPYPGQANGSPSPSAIGPGALGPGGPDGSPYGEQPYGTDPQTGQAYGWLSPPGGSSFGSPGETGPAPTETGLPWPYDRPAPSANGTTGRSPATPFASGDAGYPPGETYRPYTQDSSAFPPPGEPFPPPQAPLPPAEPPYPQAQPPYAEGSAFPSASTSYPGAETAFPTAEPSFPPAAPFGTRVTRVRRRSVRRIRRRRPTRRTRACRNGYARPAWRPSSGTGPPPAARRRRRPGTTWRTAHPTTSATPCRPCSVAGSRDARRTKGT